MGVNERKEREKHELRELIIETATKLFIEQGFEKTSIRNIADKIEYSPGTIYLYFKDKNELFYIIHEKAFAIFLDLMKTSLQIDNPFDRLHKLAEIYLNFAFENPELYDLMFIMNAPMNAEKTEEDWHCGFQSYLFLKDTVEQCIKEGYFKELHLEITTFSIFSSMHGMTALALRNRLKMYKDVDPMTLIKANIMQMLELLKK